MPRLLRPGGVVSMTIALFPSLTGGHHHTWASPDERASPFVPPWDHLRENRFPAMAYLNQYREQDFRAVFARYFRIIEWDTSQRVGEKYLSAELASELSHFTRDDLLTPNVVMLAEKGP